MMIASPPHDPFSKPVRARRARVLAVQAFYALLLSPCSFKDLMETFQGSYLQGTLGRKTDKKLFRQIMTCYDEAPQALEARLVACLKPPRNLKRLGPVLHSILLSAVSEMHLKTLPKAILITEYVQITQGFFGDGQDKLIQSLLNQLYALYEKTSSHPDDHSVLSPGNTIENVSLCQHSHEDSHHNHPHNHDGDDDHGAKERRGQNHHEAEGKGESEDNPEDNPEGKDNSEAKGDDNHEVNPEGKDNSEAKGDDNHEVNPAPEAHDHGHRESF